MTVELQRVGWNMQLSEQLVSDYQLKIYIYYVKNLLTHGQCKKVSFFSVNKSVSHYLGLSKSKNIKLCLWLCFGLSGTRHMVAPSRGSTETKCMTKTNVFKVLVKDGQCLWLLSPGFPMAALVASHLGCSKFSRLSNRSLIACSSAWKYALCDCFPLLHKPQLSRLWQATNVRHVFFIMALRRLWCRRTDAYPLQS